MLFGTTQQTLNVDSTLIYVEIMSRRRSTWYPRWFNVDLSTLIHRSNSTLKQRWFWVDSKTQFCSYIIMLEKLKLYINLEKIIVFQRRNNVSLSTVNQRQKSTLFSYNMMLGKSKPLYNVEMITVIQRRSNVSLSMLNQRQTLKLKQRWFWVDHKNIFVPMFCSNFDGRIIDVTLMHILDSIYLFWCFLKRKKIVVALSIIDKFLIFSKWESFGRVFSM